MSIVIAGKLVQRSLIRQSIVNAGIVNQEGGGGPNPPIPPIRPDSYLKYTFTQTNLTSAITDRVSGSDILTTSIGTDVNAPQTIDGGIRTFEFGENLLPASLLDWTGTGGNQFDPDGINVFTNDTGFGEYSVCHRWRVGARCHSYLTDRV